MVHALEEIRRLLSPGGVLIDIHPVQVASRIEVISAGRVFHSEAEPDTSLEDYQQAEGALADVVQRRLFVLESTSEFDLLVHSKSVSELANFVQEANAYEQRCKSQAEQVRERELMTRIEKAMREAGAGAEVAIRERARISRLSVLFPAA
jgi:hypothetical protein